MLDGNAALVLADSVAPGLQRFAGLSLGGEAAADWFVDSEDGSFAIVTEHADGSATVEEGGPDRPWERVEKVIADWRDAGCPGVERFRIRAAADGYAVTV